MKKISKLLVIIVMFTTSLFSYSGYYAPFEGTRTITQGWEGGYSHGVADGRNSNVRQGAKLAYALDIRGNNFEVLAIKSGDIIYAQWHKGFGNTIIIKHNDGLYSLYAHLSEIKINQGHVNRGNIIANSGYTGEWKGTGPHLHFQINTEYFGKTTTQINKLTNKRYSTRVNFQGFSINDVNKIAAIGYASTKSVTSKNAVNNEQTTHSSIFDGAGSLISPNEDCYGCDKDIAQMHPHSGENSTVVFQWLYDADSCSQLDIFSDESIGDVIIKSKKWNGHLTQKAFKVKLNAGSSITLKRPDNNNKWTTFAITTTEPLNFSNSITAECRTSDARFKKGIRSDVNKDLIDVSHENFWTGTGSIFSFATERGSNQFGIDKDLAVTFENQKSLTSFQWYASSSCPKLKIMNGRSSRVNSPINEVRIKGWAEENWSSNKCSSTLPCTLDAPDGEGYYVIKVKSDADAIRFGLIGAQCVQ